MSTAVEELSEFKRKARGAWAAGDYELIAKRLIWEVGERVVRRAAVSSGEDVVDIGCGTGNAAIRAAEAGARVVGVDLAPELFEPGRRLAGEAGVDLEWVEGDAEALPFEDGSFDVAISVFGCMFAPRHELAAHELARVLRAGGRLAVTAWTPDGSAGSFFHTVARHLPPPPDFAAPPTLWGSEEHVRQLFEGTGVELEFERQQVAFPRFESAEAEVEFLSTKLGPLVMARRLAEAEGRWDALRADLLALHQPQEVAEYLLIVGRKAIRAS